MKTLTSISKHSDWLDSIDIVILDKWNLHRKRVNFGKQPLAIYQFVPCKLVDGKWVVLEEPNINDFTFFYEDEDEGEYVNQEMLSESLKDYQEALDNVLFEGFENSEIGYVYLNHEIHGRLMFDEEIFEDRTIEDLVRYNLPLTKTALKEIGL